MNTPQPRTFEPNNPVLLRLLGRIREYTQDDFRICRHGFREATSAVYTWTWGGDFYKTEPGAWFSRKSTGIIRKGKNKVRDLKQSVTADHVRPQRLLFEDVKEVLGLGDEEFYYWLAEHNRIVHIHASEDEALRKRGWGNKNRPVDAYEQMGIEVYYVERYERSGPIPG